MDCIVHGVAKSRTQLSDFHSFTPFGIIRKIKRELKRNLLFHCDLMHTLEPPKNILPPQSKPSHLSSGPGIQATFFPSSE